MRLIGCLNVYQEAGFLEATLRALKRCVDLTVVVDGAYEHYPHHRPLSDDGTIDIAKQLADVVITRPTAWPTEVVKRNAYLIGKPGDWYLMNDADEVLVGDLDRSLLTDNATGYQLNMLRPPYPLMPIFRLFKHVDGLQYKEAHNLLWSPTTGYMLPESFPVINSPTFEHFTDNRDAERVLAKGTYYRWLQEEERGVRQRIKI